MSEASWAAAGMLSAHDPAHPAELAELAELSMQPLSGIPRPRLRGFRGARCGCAPRAHLVLTDETTTRGVAISAQEAQRRIPGLATEGRSFFWVEEVSLDPRDLCVALPLAAAAAGVALQEGTEVLAVRSQGDSVEVTTQSGTVSAGAFVNCCGAWAAQVQHLDLQRQPAAAVEPWKGQIFTRPSGPAARSRLRFALARGLPGAAGRGPHRDWGHGGAGGIRSPGRSFDDRTAAGPWRRSSGPPSLPPRWWKAGPGCGREPATGCR